MGSTEQKCGCILERGQTKWSPPENAEFFVKGKESRGHRPNSAPFIAAAVFQIRVEAADALDQGPPSFGH